MQDRPVLLFDVMDTLVYNPFNQEVPAFFGLTQAELVRRKNPAVWIQFELGQIDEDEYFRRYFEDGSSFDHDQFRYVVRHAYRWMDGAEQLLDRLNGQGYEIHAFSNYPIWYRTIEEQLCVSRFLKWTFVSCQTGVRKPAAAAYHGAARTLNRSFENLLFIDDSYENCQAARALGIPAIHFVDATSLRTELRARKVAV